MPPINSDTVALVTAGTSGLGLAVAERLARTGASVVVNYASNTVRANEVVSHLQRLQSESRSVDDSGREPRCLAVKADITHRDHIEHMVHETLKTMGKLDIVISNAGWTKFADFFDLDRNVDEEVWNRCFSANVKSHLFLLHVSLEHLKQAKGAFIMTSSVAGVKPSGSSIAYSVTKAAQIHLAKSLAMVAAPLVRVNAVSPGFMETNWIAGIPQEMIDRAKDKTLLKSLTNVDDVADQVILLAKAESVTGANFIFDCGLSV